MVFKYLNLIEQKEKYILGRIGIYFRGFGEKLNYFRDLGSKGKNYQGADIFQGLGDQCIICREQGIRDFPWDLVIVCLVQTQLLLLFISVSDKSFFFSKLHLSSCNTGFQCTIVTKSSVSV